MSQVNILAFLLICGSLSLASAIKCYVCTYQEGYLNENNCRTTPSGDALKEIRDEDLQRNGRSINNDGLQLFYNAVKISGAGLTEMVDGSTKATHYPYKWCGKLTGRDLAGNDVIARIGLGTLNPKDLTGGCQTVADNGVMPGVYSGKLCVCNQDGCNNSNNDNTYSGEYNGGATLIMGVLPFVSLLIPLIYSSVQL